MRLILSARRRVRWGTRALSTQGRFPLTAGAENLPRHIVSADRQLPAVDATLIPESEYIAGQASLDRKARTE